VDPLEPDDLTVPELDEVDPLKPDDLTVPELDELDPLEPEDLTVPELDDLDPLEPDDLTVPELDDLDPLDPLERTVPELPLDLVGDDERTVPDDDLEVPELDPTDPLLLLSPDDPGKDLTEPGFAADRETPESDGSKRRLVFRVPEPDTFDLSTPLLRRPYLYSRSKSTKTTSVYGLPYQPGR